MAKTPNKVKRVYESKVLLYDLDINDDQILIRTRYLIFDGNLTFFNPALTLLVDRFINERPIKVPSRLDLDPRQLRLCYANPSNDTGETNLVVFHPYASNKGEWLNFIRQVINSPNVLKVDYKGESKQNRPDSIPSPTL